MRKPLVAALSILAFAGMSTAPAVAAEPTATSVGKGADTDTVTSVVHDVVTSLFGSAVIASVLALLADLKLAGS